MNQPSPKKQAGKLQESKQQLEELLSCQICYSRANSPTLCPHCSKLYCASCLATSLRVRSQCPNCRRPLKGPLPHCSRFVGEVTAVLQSVIEGSEENERCGEHGINLNYFCQDCKRSACCECKMFGSHQHHRFTPISQLYEHKYQQIRDLLSRLRTRIVRQQHTLTCLQNELIASKTATQAHLAQIDDYSQKFKQKLASQGETNEQGEDLQRIRRQYTEFGQIRDALISQMQQAQQLNCYKIDQQLLDRLSALLLSNAQPPQGLRQVPILEEAIPPLVLNAITIPNFSKLTTSKQPFHSDPVEYEGSRWRLTLYPCGNTSPQFLSIFVEMLSNPDSLNLYLYRIELIHPHSPGLNITKQHHSRFNVNESVGYGKFVRREQLQSKQFVHQDSVTVAFGVSHCSYYELHQRRRLLLNQLEKQIEKKDDRILLLQSCSKSSLDSSFM